MSLNVHGDDRRAFLAEYGYYACGLLGCVLEEYHTGPCLPSFQPSGRRQARAVPCEPKEEEQEEEEEQEPQQPPSPEGREEEPPMVLTARPVSVIKKVRLQRPTERKTAGLGPARLGLGDGFFDGAPRVWGSAGGRTEAEPPAAEGSPPESTSPKTVRLRLNGAWWRPPVFTKAEQEAADRILALARSGKA
eukprot:4610202-Prymnesium_polylepis.1